MTGLIASATAKGSDTAPTAERVAVYAAGMERQRAQSRATSSGRQLRRTGEAASRSAAHSRYDQASI